jgi:hypothetical protein
MVRSANTQRGRARNRRRDGDCDYNHFLEWHHPPPLMLELRADFGGQFKGKKFAQCVGHHKPLERITTRANNIL